MGYVITHADGETQANPALDCLAGLVAELDIASNRDHADVAIMDEDTGWSLSAYRGGSLLWENLLDAEAGTHHCGQLHGAARDDVLRLFLHIARGEIDAVAELPWGRCAVTPYE